MHSLSTRRLTRVLLAMLAATLLASCGGGGSDNPATTTTTPAGSSGTTTLPASELVNTYAAALSGTQADPSNTSQASGTGTVLVNPDTRDFSATLTVFGVKGTAASIQPVPAGTSNATTGATGASGATSAGIGTIALAESPPGSGVWTARGTLSDTQLAALQAGTLAFKVNGAALPNGEIRGVILTQLAGSSNTATGSVTGGSGSTGTNATASTTATAQSSTAFIASLRGSQETPPVTSAAQGSGALIVEPGSLSFIAAVTTTGINGMAAHIHIGAPGTAGPIAIPLAQVGNGSGIWFAKGIFSQDQFNALMQGNLYFNVHSTAFPNGEIRGQVLPVVQQAPGSANGAAGANIGATGGTTGVDPGLGTGIGASNVTGAMTGTGTGTATGMGTSMGTGTGISTGIGTGLGLTGTGTTGTGIGLTGTSSTGMGTTGIGTSTTGLPLNTTTVTPPTATTTNLF